MSKIRLILVGIVAIFMLKQSFYIQPNVGQKNYWIVIGMILLVIYSIENYLLRLNNQKRVAREILENMEIIKQASHQQGLGDSARVMMGVDLQLELQLKNIIKRDGMIQAIKHLREETGMGLKEAKDFCESLS